MKTKEEHAEMMADDFNTLMSQYEMHEIDATETVLLGLQILKRYLESSHYMYQTPYFKIVSLCEAAEKTGKKSRYRTLDKYFLQGCLIEGINKFSARRIKSEAIYNFINDYLGIDRSESVRSLKLFKQWYYSPGENQEAAEFSEECYHWIVEFLASLKSRDVPNQKEYPEVHNGFIALKESCEKIYEDNKKMAYSARRMRPFENDLEPTFSYQKAD